MSKHGVLRCRVKSLGLSHPWFWFFNSFSFIDICINDNFLPCLHNQDIRLLDKLEFTEEVHISSFKSFRIIICQGPYFLTYHIRIKSVILLKVVFFNIQRSPLNIILCKCSTMFQIYLLWCLS